MSMEELKARREAMRKADAEAEAKQAEVDFAALVDAEEEHGFGAVRPIKVKQYREGLPTMAIVKSPGGTHLFKAFQQETMNAKHGAKKIEAAESFGLASIVYPSGELLASMLKAFPGLASSAAAVAAELAMGEAEEEKKG